MSVTKAKFRAAWEKSDTAKAYQKIVDQVRACAVQGMTRAEAASHLGYAYNRVYVIANQQDITFAVRRSNRAANIKAAKVREVQQHRAAVTHRQAGIPNYAGIKAALRW
jgi:hypothetical protein